MKAKVITIVIITLMLSICAIINMEISGDEVDNIPISTTSTTSTETKLTTVTTTTTTKKKITTKTTTTTKEGTYRITHYGPDCKGCSGNTASGYKVNNTIYYVDKTYGKLHVLAMSSDIPLYTVIEISNYKFGKIYGIVLDRGVGKGVIDVLCESEHKASQMGVQSNVEISILRWGK